MTASYNCMVSETAKTAMICVDSYEQKLFCGRIYYKGFSQKTEFCNLMQLLGIIDGAIKPIGFPEPHIKPKSFCDFQQAETRLIKSPKKDGFKEARGKLATFTVKILFQQNVSWQGIVSWLEGHRKESFRSAYELIMLMDNAIEYSKGAAGEKKEPQES